MTKSQNTGTRFSRESQLLDPVARFAKLKGFCLQTAELPFYEYRIDLYGFSSERNVTIAVELKLADWRRALDQAMLYQLCSDLVYIAMPEKSAKKVNMTELRDNRVGLIAVLESGACSCVIKALEHDEVRECYRSAQIDFLKDNASA